MCHFHKKALKLQIKTLIMGRMARIVGYVDVGTVLQQVVTNFHHIYQRTPRWLTLSLCTIAASCAPGMKSAICNCLYIEMGYALVCWYSILKYRCITILQNAPIVREWVGLRPTRKTLRVERELMKFPSGNLQVSLNEISPLTDTLYLLHISWFSFSTSSSRKTYADNYNRFLTDPMLFLCLSNNV